jgi:signal peptide peptidase SppA
MPLPTPRPNEDEDDFMSRCMGDDGMNDEFPDQAQRMAVCRRQWDDAHAAALLPESPACWHHHLGIWAVLPTAFLPAVYAYRREGMAAFQAQARPQRLYEVHDDGIAVIPLQGFLTKGPSKFESTSTVLARRALRHAAQDEAVQAILLYIDSPGGHVAGTDTLARDVARIDQTRKPVWAHIDELGASAAYWIASQAYRISANDTAEIGSIGTMAVVEDSSGRMDRLGITVHVVSTGPYKGAGVEGAPVSKQMLAYLQDRVQDLNSHFLAAVQRGRRYSPDHLKTVSDGRVWIAQRAHDLRLIDAVQDFETTLSQMRSSPPASEARRPAVSVAHLDTLLRKRKDGVYGRNRAETA